MNTVMLAVFSPAYSFCELSEKLFLVVTFAKMLRTENQGIGEGFRESMKRIASVFGTVFAVYVIDYFQYSFFVLLITVSYIFCCLIHKRRMYSNPKLII